MRTTIVSTSHLKFTKAFGSSIILAIGVVILVISIMQIINGQFFSGLTIAVMWVFILYKMFKLMWSLKTITFDDSSVFYEKEGFEVQIPFEDIRDIEIKTLTGIYIINLYRTAPDGKKIAFKMSLWYPLNFKKQDEKVNVLRDKIDRYKRTLQAQNYNELPSYSIK